MKKLITAISILSISLTGYGQWSNTGDNHTTGKVGIGLSNPWEKLTIEPGYLTLSNNKSNDKEIGSLNFANRAISGASSTSTLASIRVKTALGAHYAGNMMFDVRSGGATYEAMRLRYDGNLGIGHSDPWAKLTIHPGYLTLSNNIPGNYTEVGGISFNNIAIAGSNSSSDLARIRVETAGAKYGSSLIFDVRSGSAPYEAMRIDPYGKVGIGTVSTGSHKLAVEGSIGAREIKVEASGWSDFVFEEDYDLRNLDEVNDFIQENGHLPDIPSEAEVLDEGINLGEMNAKLLQKIEELTLYLINQNKELKHLKDQNEIHLQRIEKLEKVPNK